MTATKSIQLGIVGACLACAHAFAQEVTPVWVQHINGVVNVADTNKLPILVKPTGTVVAAPDGAYLDGREPISYFMRLIPFDAQRLLLAVRENGIDEQNTALPQAQKDLAARFPDRSLIWLDAATGRPLGIAWTESLRAADLIGYDVTAPHTGYQTSKMNQLWRPALDENPDPTKRAIYSGYKHLILRYAPKADGSGWETTPTIAWEEQVAGLGDDGSVAPEAGIGDGLTGTASEGGEQGSWRSIRWRDIRVSGFGTNTLILAGGGTWRVGAHPQVFGTTDGLKFAPAARVNDRDNGRRNGYSLGGCSSEVVAYGSDPARPKLQVVYHGHYPGTGWEARPNRYTSDPDKPSPSPEYNQQPNVRLFNQDEAASGGLPAFVWEAAGKDGKPINHAVDGVDVYDGNWNMSLAASPKLDYIVALSGSSLDVSWQTYGWLAVHRLDGSISSGKSSYKLPFKEDDITVDYANLGGGPESDFDSTESWVDVVPDPAAPANQGKSFAYAAFSEGGFGVFLIQNVAAAVTSEPSDLTIVAGTTNSLSASATGSPNTYRWKRNGVLLADGKYITGSKTTKLTILDATKDDAGAYELEIQNPLSGTVTTKAVNVKVTGAYVRPHQNAALNGTATQVTTYPGGEASEAIDGNTNQTWSVNSIAHTADGTTNSVVWWEVDLKSALDIGRVVYFPRSDCCEERQADVNIVILDEARKEVSRTNINVNGFTFPDPWTQNYSPTVKGRYVRIERVPAGEPDANGVPTDAYLNIAEVQVFNAFRPTLDVGVQGSQIAVAWDADAFSTPTLETAPSVTGPWTTLTSTSPFTGPMAGTAFYRLKVQ